MPELNVNDALKHLARKRAEEQAWRGGKVDNFWEYAQYMDGDFFIDERVYLREIAYAMEKVALGEILYLMVHLPPQCGKSYMASMFSSWMLGKHPDGTVMRNSYGAKLAEKFSADIQRIIMSRKFSRIFPGIEMSKDKTSKDEWALSTAKDFSYVCSGVSGGSTGFGCNLVAILDDPVKDMMEALSLSRLESILEWYITVHRTRMRQVPPTPEIIICTRWSKNDIAGKMLQTEGLLSEGGKWVVINYPLLVDEKSFCEAHMSTERALEIRKTFSDTDNMWAFNSIYQQNPMSKTGILFPENKLDRYRLADLPDFEYKIGFCDVADRGKDNLCSIVGGVYEGKCYILPEVVFTRMSQKRTEPLVASQINTVQPNSFTFESNAGGRSYGRKVGSMLRVGTLVRYKYSSKNKEGRILLASGDIIRDFVFLVDEEQDGQYKRYFQQMINYYAGGINQPDDAPDATASLSEMIEKRGEVKVSTLSGE